MRERPAAQPHRHRHEGDRGDVLIDADPLDQRIVGRAAGQGAHSVVVARLEDPRHVPEEDVPQHAAAHACEGAHEDRGDGQEAMHDGFVRPAPGK